MKVQCLQKRLVLPIGNFDMFTPVREIYVGLKFPYMYAYLIKLSRKSLEVIYNNLIPNVMQLDKKTPLAECVRGLNLAVFRHTTLNVLTAASEW
jgi:hypothetical protein